MKHNGKKPEATEGGTARFEGMTATGMFEHLWHTCQELRDMLEECRARLAKETRGDEATAFLNDALDQSARCFSDQLDAIATFARHAWLWKNNPMNHSMQAWMGSEEGQAAFEEAKKKYGMPLAIVKTTEGKFKFAPPSKE